MGPLISFTEASNNDIATNTHAGVTINILYICSNKAYLSKILYIFINIYIYIYIYIYVCVCVCVCVCVYVCVCQRLHNDKSTRGSY